MMAMDTCLHIISIQVDEYLENMAGILAVYKGEGPGVNPEALHILAKPKEF